MHRSSPVPHLSFHDISFVVVEDQPLVCMLWKAAFEKSSVPERQALVLGSEPGEALSVVDPENSPLRARLVAARESRCSHFIVVLDQYLITAPGERLTGIDVLQSLSARPWFREAVDDGLLSVFFDSGVNEDELRTELTSAQLPADAVQGFFGKKMGRGFPTYPEKLGTMLELAVARRAALAMQQVRAVRVNPRRPSCKRPRRAGAPSRVCGEPASALLAGHQGGEEDGLLRQSRAVSDQGGGGP